jgi:tetratricopeptide (TPR) repeat protein
MISQRLCSGRNLEGGVPVDNQVIIQLEQSYYRGEHSRVAYRCDQLLQDPALAPLRASLLFWKGMARQAIGPAWYGQAMSYLREALALARRDRPLKARIIGALGKLHALAGDCPPFDKLMEEFARISADNDPNVMRYGSFVWFNYGCTLDNAFRYGDAVPAFTRAAELAEQYNQPRVQGLSFHNLSGAHLCLGNLTEALAAMTRAEALITTEDWKHKQLSRRAEYALTAGNTMEAQQLITEALLHPHVDDMTRADVYYTWARTLVQLGRPQEAADKALRALDFAMKDVHFPCIHKANRLLQQLNPSL